MTEMISFGAGVNSVAMTIMLVNDGWRGPIVFADTAGEHPETYCYLTYFSRWLEERGLEITRLTYETMPRLYAHDKRIGSTRGATLWQYCYDSGIIPLLAKRWCSVTFKRGPLEAWRREHDIGICLLGICASEPRRIRDDPNVRYPLYEEGITREGCKRIIRAAGLEVPRKSGCFFCPGQRIGEWKRLYYEQPALYERAVQLEENASQHCQKWATLDPHGISLRQHAERRWEGQTEMDLSEWIPCLCSL